MPKPKGHRAHDREPKFILDRRTGNYVVVYYPDPTSGRRKFLSTRTSDAAAAKAFWEAHRDRLGAVRRGHEHLATREQAAFTVGQALDLVVQDYQANDHTSDSITGTIAHVKQELGSVSIEKLDLDRILEARVAWAKQGRAKGTINRYLSLVRRGVTLARERRRIATTPGFKWPKYDERPFIRKGFVSLEELTTVNAAEPWAVCRDFNTWAFWTGMRFSESAALQWEDYDRPTHTVRLGAGDAKSGEGRVLPLPPGPLRELIDRRWADRRPGCPWIFHHEGAQLHDTDRWRMAWQRAGLPMRPRKSDDTRNHKQRPGKLFHDLRRTGVRNLVRALVAAGVGAPEKTAMLISGHKTRAIFDRYNITEESEVATALEALTQYHARQAPPPAAPMAGVLPFTPRPRRGSSTRAGRVVRTARPGRSAG